MPVNVGQIVISLGANTQAFSLELTRAQQLAAQKGQEITGTLNKLSGAATGWGSKTQEASHHAVSGMQATSAALRTMEGNMTNNLRAAERFVAQVLGMGEILKAAFPVVGAIAMLGIFDELYTRGKKVYDFFEHMANAPQYIADSFRQLSGPLRDTNDQMQVANDKLQMELDKLNGHPGNGLKLAIDEAVASADKLGEALGKDNEQLTKLLKENQQGIWARIFGNAGTKDITEAFGGTNGLGGFRERINDITARGTEAIRQSTDAKAKDAAQTKLSTELSKAYGEQIKWTHDQLKESQFLQKQHDTSSARRFNNLDMTGANSMHSASTVSVTDQTGRISILQQSLQALELEASQIGLTVQGDSLTKKVEQARTALEAHKQDAYGQKMAELSSQLAEAEAESKAKPRDDFSGAQARAAGQSQLAMAEVNTKLAETHRTLTLGQRAEIVATITQTEMTKLQTEEKQKQAKINEDLKEGALAMSLEIARADQQSQVRIKSMTDEANETRVLADAYALGADAVTAAQKKIMLAKMKDASDAEKLAAGNLFDAKDEAATEKQIVSLQRQTAATVTLTKAENLGLEARRKAALENIASSGESSDIIKAKQDALKAQWSQSDTSTLRNSTAADGVKVYFQEMKDNAKSAGQVMHDTIGGAITGMNDNLSRLVTGQKTSFASLFQSIAASFAQFGLMKLETQFLAPLLGGGGSGAASGAGGGLLKSIFGGFKAGGGDVDPSKGFVVGENGPEWFNPPTKGTIVPNHQLGAGGASYYIDARGGSGPEIEQRVQRALTQVHGNAVRSAMAAQQEVRARRPRSKF